MMIPLKEYRNPNPEHLKHGRLKWLRLENIRSVHPTEWQMKHLGYPDTPYPGWCSCLRDCVQGWDSRGSMDNLAQLVSVFVDVWGYRWVRYWTEKGRPR